MNKINISIVSYSNTIPFVYGIEQSQYLDKSSFTLYKDNPAQCFERIKNNQADIGIIPVATIPLLNNVEIFSDFCIGAERNVKSVILASNVPLNEIKKVFLDYQSRTSNMLVQVLAKHHWRLDLEYVRSDTGYEEKIENTTAGVIIGNRALELQKNYKYVYDLAGEWFSFTGLPFVFACWVKNKEIPEKFIEDFNRALKSGINNIDKITSNEPELNYYLKENINFQLDDRKNEAMKLFWLLSKEL